MADSRLTTRQWQRFNPLLVRLERDEQCDDRRCQGESGPYISLLAEPRGKNGPHRILNSEDAILVDFHNQRLHSVVAKPYDDEAKRFHRGIAIRRPLCWNDPACAAR